MSAPKLGNLVPYLFYRDIEAMIDWYSRVFGFVEKERWRGPDGHVHNAEMVVADTELWMDGGPNTGRHKLTDANGNPLSLWIGVWLDDPDAVDSMYEHITAQGVVADKPGDQPFGVRTFNVKDPEGYTWGSICHIPRPP